MAKKNVTGKSKAKRTAGTFLRLKPQLKEDAQIWAIKNKIRERRMALPLPWLKDDQ
jgi:hypothetical protein